MTTEKKTFRLQPGTLEQIEKCALKNKMNQTQAISDMIGVAYKMQIESEDFQVPRVLYS